MVKISWLRIQILKLKDFRKQSVNSCGLYGCDLKSIVEVASRIAEEEYEELYESC